MLHSVGCCQIPTNSQREMSAMSTQIEGTGAMIDNGCQPPCKCLKPSLLPNAEVCSAKDLRLCVLCTSPRSYLLGSWNPRGRPSLDTTSLFTRCPTRWCPSRRPNGHAWRCVCSDASGWSELQRRSGTMLQACRSGRDDHRNPGSQSPFCPRGYAVNRRTRVLGLRCRWSFLTACLRVAAAGAATANAARSVRASCSSSRESQAS